MLVFAMKLSRSQTANGTARERCRRLREVLPESGIEDITVRPFVRAPEGTAAKGIDDYASALTGISTPGTTQMAVIQEEISLERR